MKKTLALSILIISAVHATAQDREQTLDPVTITSSLQAKPVSQTGRNIVSFKGEEFNNLPVHSVDELLRYLPGVEVQMRGPMGAQSDIVLRGGTFQQVLVLLDGVRINDPNTGHFTSYIPIAPAEIERIEVLKGASSAIYGSEAVGGVIQIITKTFASRQNQNKLQVQAQASAGEYNLLNANGGMFYQKGNTAIGAGLLSLNTDGQPQRGINGFLNNNTVSASVSHFFNSKWQLAVRGAYDSRDFAAQNFYTTFASDTASEKVQSVWTMARLSYTGNKHRLNINAGFKSLRDQYLFSKTAVANDNKSKMLQAVVTDEWTIGSTTTITSGAQFINKKIRSNDRGNHEVPQAAAFIILNQEIAKGFIINPALRVDWNDRSGTELIPQINLSYKVAKVQLRGSAGKTIRDADFTERYNNYNKAIVTRGSIGDPNLEAERSFSYEIGADYFLSSALKISGTFFQRLHKKLIDFVNTPYADMPRKDNLSPTGTYALAKNIAEVTTTGAEVDIQFQQKINGQWMLYASTGLLWLDSKSSNTIPSFYISSHAKFMSNFFVQTMYKNFSISVSGIYKTRATQKAIPINAEVSKNYFVFNTKASFFFCQKKLNIFVQADNVFNKKYSDLLGAVMPERWIRAGLSFSFSK